MNRNKPKSKQHVSGQSLTVEAGRRKDDITPYLWFTRLVCETTGVKSYWNRSLLRWSAFLRCFLCTLFNDKLHWFIPPGKQLFRNIIGVGEASVRQPMENMFPGSLKPSRQCSCCLTNTEIYIVCQVHAPDLDVQLARNSHILFQHNCLLHFKISKLAFVFSITRKRQPTVRNAGTYLLPIKFP